MSDRAWLNHYSQLFHTFIYQRLDLLPIVISLGLTLLTILIKLLRWKTQKPTHTKVSCWFCSDAQVHLVPNEIANSWTCPSCQQYNGFSPDGGSNKILPEQYDEKLNPKSSCLPDSSSILPKSGPFCSNCQLNMQAKQKIISQFCPRDESNYEVEFEAFKQNLDSLYPLCNGCSKSSQRVIEAQNQRLQLLGLLPPSVASSPSKKENSLSSSPVFIDGKRPQSSSTFKMIFLHSLRKSLSIMAFVVSLLLFLNGYCKLQENVQREAYPLLNSISSVFGILGRDSDIQMLSLLGLMSDLTVMVLMNSNLSLLNSVCVTIWLLLQWIHSPFSASTLPETDKYLMWSLLSGLLFSLYVINGISVKYASSRQPKKILKLPKRVPVLRSLHRSSPKDQTPKNAPLKNESPQRPEMNKSTCNGQSNEFIHSIDSHIADLSLGRGDHKAKSEYIGNSRKIGSPQARSVCTSPVMNQHSTYPRKSLVQPPKFVPQSTMGSPSIVRSTTARSLFSDEIMNRSFSALSFNRENYIPTPPPSSADGSEQGSEIGNNSRGWNIDSNFQHLHMDGIRKRGDERFSLSGKRSPETSDIRSRSSTVNSSPTIIKKKIVIIKEQSSNVCATLILAFVLLLIFLGVVILSLPNMFVVNHFQENVAPSRLPKVATPPNIITETAIRLFGDLPQSPAHNLVPFDQNPTNQGEDYNSD